jgi:1,4-alpha-glucan branching enzyme
MEKKATRAKKSSKKTAEKMKKKATRLKETSKKAVEKGMKKQYLKTRQDCRVTFRLPKEAATDAMYVSIVGDFNNWSITETPLKKLKNGDFTATITLPCNREYKFRYLIDSDRWENDWCADKYVPNCYGGDDSVVVVRKSPGKACGIRG